MRPTPEAVVVAIRARGNDATDLRDAAHEAHHALDAAVPAGRWDRETIHRYLSRKRLGDQLISEIMARAVEQIVCADLGVDCGAVETWALTACLEALKDGIRFPGPTWFAERVREYMARPEARKAADVVLELAREPVQKRRRRAA